MRRGRGQVHVCAHGVARSVGMAWEARRVSGTRVRARAMLQQASRAAWPVVLVPMAEHRARQSYGMALVGRHGGDAACRPAGALNGTCVQAQRRVHASSGLLQRSGAINGVRHNGQGWARGRRGSQLRLSPTKHAKLHQDT